MSRLAPSDGVSVIVPAYNEEGAIAAFLDDLLYQLGKLDRPFEVVVVDDGSTDRTRERADGHGAAVRVVAHATNRGYGATLKTGLRAARHPVAVIIDADGTYAPGDIPRLLDAMDDGVEMVVGARTGETAQIPPLRRPAKWALRRLAEWLSDQRIPDLNSGLRAFRRRTALRYAHLLPNRFSFTSTITLLLLSDGYDVRFLPVEYRVRVGRSKLRTVDALGFLTLIVRTVTYFSPLRVFLPASLAFLALTAVSLAHDVLVLANLTDASIILFVATFLTAAIGILADLIVRRR